MTTRKPPADHAQREAIRNDLAVTMLVEAAAGTGKTTSLVARLVNLVRRRNISPANIAAITFTVKAAAQLRERVQLGLEEALREAGDEERARLQEALQNLDRGFIGTTHAFCARLLRERPVEAGLDPEFEELDETAAKVQREEFWNRWYESELLAGSAWIEETRELGLERWQLRSAFVRVVEYSDLVMVSTRLPRPDLRAVCDELVRIVDECLPHLPTDAHRDEPDAFERMIVSLDRRRRSMDLGTLSAQLTFLAEGNHASQKPVQKRWPDKGVAKQLGVLYEAFVRGTLRPMLQKWTEHVHGVAMEVLTRAANEFEEERRHEGTLTYQDLLTCTRDLLRDHPAVRRSFQRRFQHVLVDEFQDTDPLQAEILFYLTGSDTEERDWRKLEPCPGSLFIVGDPKQSIYRFRRADITTYLDVRKRIEESGGRVVPLFTNFRSAPSICSFVNDSFSTIFSAVDVAAGRQAPHVDLSPDRDVPPLHGVFSLETPRATNDSMAMAEARTIASWIRGAFDSKLCIGDDDGERPMRWSDVLLISYQRPRLHHYAAALEAAGIPYEITGGKAFQKPAAIEPAMPLLRAVSDPDDVVSLVGFLRGPLCGVDDEALYRFVRGGNVFSPFRELPPDTDERIVRGLDIVRKSIQDAERNPPAAAIARIFERIGLAGLAATEERAGRASGNLLLAQTIARSASARGESFAAIVARFDELLDNPPDIGELDVDPARGDAVRLMNLHQVKGLEAPIVFLIDPAEPFEYPVDLHVDRSTHESLGYLGITRKSGYQDVDVGVPLGWQKMQQVEREFLDAEKRRLLYVAATRARNVLVAGFTRSARGAEGAWRELASRVKTPLFAVAAGDRSVSNVAESLPSFDEAMAAIRAQFENAARESYSVLPITKIAHGSHAELVRAEEGLGRGTSWGRVLHRLFEAMLRIETLDVRLYAGNLLKDEERDAVELEEVLRVVEAVQSSPLWQRVKAADERYVEVPFALNVPRRDVGLDEDGETLLHGTIDLAFREGGEWFIVDYKSDSTANRLDALVAYYTPQVQHYAKFWSQLTGSPARGGLFFVDGCVERWV